MQNMDQFEILFLILISIVIAIAIIAITVNRAQARAAKRTAEAEERARADAAAAKRRAEIEAERRKKELINNLTQKYMSNPYTIEAAEAFTKAFIKALDSLNRDIRNATVSMKNVGISLILITVCVIEFQRLAITCKQEKTIEMMTPSS